MKFKNFTITDRKNIIYIYIYILISDDLSYENYQIYYNFCKTMIL